MLAPENNGLVTLQEDAARGAAIRLFARQDGPRRTLGAFNRRKAENEFAQEAIFKS